MQSQESPHRAQIKWMTVYVTAYRTFVDGRECWSERTAVLLKRIYIATQRDCHRPAVLLTYSQDWKWSVVVKTLVVLSSWYKIW